LQSAKWYFRIDEAEAQELMDQLGAYFRDIDRRLSAEADADPQLHGMGTTLTGAYVVGGNLFVVHVGDSRCYLYRGGKLQQITRDHTLAQEMADAGQISQQSAGRHRMRNVLTRYIGGSDGNIQSEVHWLPLVTADRVLLCSDGLNGMVADEEIALHLAEHCDPNAACESLIGAALEAGGRDNITVIVADVEIG
jgi:serine/threonine protein phosphatase PrpC